MTLLEETTWSLETNKKSWSDVKWIGTHKGTIPIAKFKVDADKSYDSGYGSAKVNEYLIIAGDDWWLERYEYDGSERWVFKTMPTKTDRREIIDIWYDY
jgi:hypothetical protein